MEIREAKKIQWNVDLLFFSNTLFNILFRRRIELQIRGIPLISIHFFSSFLLYFISLQIIRGRTLFKLNIYDEQFGLFVSYSQMDSLELPALRDILAGSVFMFNNQNLCHIQTINWDEIITGTKSNHI